MHSETIIKDNKAYKIEMGYQLTSNWKYRGLGKVYYNDNLIYSFTCLKEQSVRWDTSCDAWDQLRSLGFKRQPIF